NFRESRSSRTPRTQASRLPAIRASPWQWSDTTRATSRWSTAMWLWTRRGYSLSFGTCLSSRGWRRSARHCGFRTDGYRPVPQVEVMHRQGSSGSSADPRWLASACELVRHDRGRFEYVVFRMAAAVGLGLRRVVYGLAYIVSRKEHYRRLATDMSVYARWAIGRR